MIFQVFKRKNKNLIIDGFYEEKLNNYYERLSLSYQILHLILVTITLFSFCMESIYVYMCLELCE